jgi:hypothetical protein
MNLEQLKRDVGHQVKIVPPACHLDAASDPLPSLNEDWTIEAVTNDYVEIHAASGHRYRLAKDHIRNFTADVQSSTGDNKHGFLTLHVQLVVEGVNVKAVPNERPGAAVIPPIDRARRARGVFAAELERTFRRQVEILGRVVPNYTMTSLGKGSCPGDTWISLTPTEPTLYPTAPVFQDLSTTDAELLSEFYAATREVVDLLARWIAEGTSLGEYNAWNYLMHKVEHTLRAGAQAVQRYCPDRRFDATSPAGGTLLAQSERALSIAEHARSAFLARFAASQVQAKTPQVRRR